MTEKFVASNGIKINECGYPVGIAGTTVDPIGVHNARREFYQHERDTKLGRWREKVDSQWVVYPVRVFAGESRAVRVVQETTGYSRKFTEDALNDPDGIALMGVGSARAYFAAHPVKQPWHDAYRNELWLLDIQGSSGLKPYLVVDGTGCQDGLVFRQVIHIEGTGFDVDSPYIRSGHRIYPEVSDA